MSTNAKKTQTINQEIFEDLAVGFEMINETSDGYYGYKGIKVQGADIIQVEKYGDEGEIERTKYFVLAEVPFVIPTPPEDDEEAADVPDENDVTESFFPRKK